MENQRAAVVACSVARQLTRTDRQVVASWIESLLNIARSTGSRTEKALAAIAATRKADVVLPITVLIAKESKRICWDERSWPSRLALSGLAVGVVVFGGEGAGIAAGGTAIGVPLWIVLGAGGAFAGALLEEIKRASKNP
jgi:hypothetical protein